jgi:hypothetical protein
MFCSFILIHSSKLLIGERNLRQAVKNVIIIRNFNIGQVSKLYRFKIGA